MIRITKRRTSSLKSTPQKKVYVEDIRPFVPYVLDSSSSPPLYHRQIVCAQNIDSMVPSTVITPYTTILTVRVMPRSLKLIFGISGFPWGCSPWLFVCCSRSRSWEVEKDERMRLLIGCGDELGRASNEYCGMWGLPAALRKDAERWLDSIFMVDIESVIFCRQNTYQVGAELLESQIFWFVVYILKPREAEPGSWIYKVHGSWMQIRVSAIRS